MPFVMPFLPLMRDSAGWFVIRSRRSACWRMVAQSKIVYNIVYQYLLLALGSLVRTARRGAQSLFDGNADGGKIGQIGNGAGAEIPRGTAAPAREPAAAVVIARRIEEDIVLGRRQPRERLIEQDLCELFQTHRGDVRLALFELEKKGLVERIPNRGALVRGLTPQEVRKSTRSARSLRSWR